MTFNDNAARNKMGLCGLALLLALGMAGCGGGGGGSSTSAPAGTSALNGVAAVGTPIVNASISVVCATGSPLSTTTSNTGTGGAWQVALSGQTLPCAVELTNGTINGAANTTPYHAIAIAAGTVNVTPLTDFMVANLAGTATPGTWFTGLTTNPSALSEITQAQANTALAALSNALSGLSELPSNNPVTTPFTPTAGNVSDDMLSALATALSNTPGVTYASLLGEVAASTASTTSVTAAFETNLATAYAAAASGSYTVGGRVSGLTGSVVLQDNGGSNLTVTANGAFTFSTNLANNAAYDVTVLTQPSGQTCTVSNGAGVVSGGNITNVAVVCSSNSNTYTVSGTVSGLVGSLVLQDNNANNLAISANGTFAFGISVASGSPYSVTVLTHPAGQSCSVSNGSGTIGTSDVSNVAVTCSTNSYSVGGTVSGLSGSMVLQDNGGNNLTVSTNGIFNFSAAVPYGSAYSVTIFTQPSGQTCTVTGSSGTVNANVSSVAVACTTNSGLSAGQNVMPIIVDGGPAGVDAMNTPYTSVTLCTPGTSTCQTIDHIIVDTGSTGLRIIASALSSSLSLTQQTSGSENLDECLQFADGYTWGSVKVADVQLGAEPTIHSLEVQIIGDPAAASVPRGCASTGISEDTVTTFGGNGILGVGTFQQDCGSTCVATPAVSGAYYACSTSSGSSCTAIAVPLAQQIQNPVGMLSSDNNGVAITMPAVAATGSAAVSGSLILGIGTQSNNALVGVTVYQIDPTYGYLTTSFNGGSYTESFLDSGSNALYFPDYSITQCSGNNSGFYCPASTISLTATNQGSNGTSGTISFSVVNADTLFGNASYTAASGLGGTAIGPGSFDWGFPFFFGRTVFTSLEGTSSGGASGPYFAY